MFAMNDNDKDKVENVSMLQKDSVRVQAVLIEINSRLLFVRDQVTKTKIEAAVIEERRKNWQQFEKILEEMRSKFAK